jgi:peptide-methionine (S)-S-oxide reductase
MSGHRTSRAFLAGLVVVATAVCFAAVVVRGARRERPLPRHERAVREVHTMEDLQQATFAAGCFWHVEAMFRRVPGVVDTRVGYTGGSRANPTYRQVCTGTTGHAEAVRVIFDPARVGYEELLRVFWEGHDPTTRNRQGPDVGSQYRSAIFYHTDEQRLRAERSRDLLQTSGRYVGRPIVTEIIPAGTFWEAEEYHQRYFEKHGAVCGS